MRLTTNQKHPHPLVHRVFRCCCSLTERELLVLVWRIEIRMCLAAGLQLKFVSITVFVILIAEFASSRHWHVLRIVMLVN